MIILTLRTDNPEAEVGLHRDDQRLAYETWLAHRELSDTIHMKIEEILDLLSISLEKVQGVIVYKGLGSFTGLRIGMSVANALSYSLGIPIVAKSGQNWVELGTKALRAGENDKIALPEYGQAPKTTKPRK